MVPRRKTRKPSVDLAPEVLSAVDGLERALRVSQLRAGKTQKKALGRHVHGAPYAYSSDRGLASAGRGLAPIVVRIFSEVTHGCSPGQVARGLNEEGISAPQR